MITLGYEYKQPCSDMTWNRTGWQQEFTHDPQIWRLPPSCHYQTARPDPEETSGATSGFALLASRSSSMLGAV